MAIVDDDIERVRDATVISDVVQQYVALRRVGRNWVGLCPFHAERSGSFNVRDETGRYKCFGCQAGGDVFKFVQDIEHIDFVTAVEQLANKAGIELRYTTGGESGDRKRRAKLVAAMREAVAWYHQRLLTAPDARAARDYLRQRGLAGDVARQFQLGWAPDEWDALSRQSAVPAELLRETGLAFTNKSGRLQDAFRGRVLFPIFTDNGDPVAFGGRILPGSNDPAKYKNSSETPIYAKSKTLYGLNWAKGDVVGNDQVIVCEGYTDVIGFHRAGVRRAVATCGTALTEDHVRTLKRYASRVVLAFDADAAGQSAAEKFYEWEKKYDVQVSVARFPDGRDPGDLSVSAPEALSAAVDDALPFLGFRVERVLAGRPLRSPEAKAKVASDAMAVINEHPDANVRKLYAGQVASHVGLPATDLVAAAERPRQRPQIRVADAMSGLRRAKVAEDAEFVAVGLLLQRWNEIAEWLIEPLFSDDTARRAFLAVADSQGDVEGSLAAADPEARELIERAAVVDGDWDPARLAFTLIADQTRRVLRTRRWTGNSDELREDVSARRSLELLDDPAAAPAAAEALLVWLQQRTEESQ
jgi:DNA primase